MNKIYAFHGGDSKAGVTMISHSVAQLVAKEFPKEDVLLISLSPTQSNQFLREEIDSIDYFKNKIESGLSIEKENLKQGRLQDNLYMIDGLREELQQRLYFPGNVKSFAEGLKESFRIIIVDTGSQIDNGLSVGGLLSSDMNFLVIQQSEVALERFSKRKNIYEKGDIKFDYYIINRYDEKDLLDIEYIKRKIGIKRTEYVTIRDVKCGRKAEYERKTFVDMKDTLFMSDLNKIVDIIAGDSGIGNDRREKRKKWRNFI